MRRANRVDENHAEIRDALRAAGAVVVDTSHIGQGFPDILCSFKGQVHMIEIKDGTKSASQTRLTKDQIAFHVEQASVGVMVFVVYDTDQALRVIGARRTA